MYMQLAALGRWISVVITLGLYFSGWTIAISYFKDVNDVNDETWVRIFTIIWAIIHIVMLILWIVWSWAVV